MASVVLSTAGATIGSSIPGIAPVLGSTLGQAVGTQLGGVVDEAIFGVPTRTLEGPRLADLSVQVSTYGTFIPVVYGTMRIAGNIIWSRPIREVSNRSTSRSGGGKGGGGAATTTTTYDYSVTLAIALCEGVIHDVVRAWADSELLDMAGGSYRIYRGEDDQLPDSIIESYEGVGSTPAYRGLAYIVIENFSLAEYGNRIPNFTFEIKRPVAVPDYQGQTTEEMVRSMTLIPGAGEFVYDTVQQYKIFGEYTGVGFAQSEAEEPINSHASTEKSNVLVSLDQLQATCPNLEWISIIITWFGTDMDAGQCNIVPGVEFSSGAITEPDAWQVGQQTRDSAYVITNENGTPRYGGTPSDSSVIRLIDECHVRGLQVMVYPMFFMDVSGKPWRGRVTGSAGGMAGFFTKPNGYNAFITHYADLTQGKADAFVIGSELIGLTHVSALPGVYPAVDALVNLAASVKQIMGASTRVTYAADWSEYHHTDGGWYNMDPIWASPHIDMIGIDAYFPLTNASQRELGYDVQPVIDGWDTGEGYEFYYVDGARTITAPLDTPYAWKNLDWFWRNTHINPDGNPTAWVPQSKKIWFTEYGFPSVDGATNQPNVFYDPDSVEGFFPRLSRGVVDFRAQRVGITATEARWQSSDMLERLFLWTWDARPYPYYPDLWRVWADGGVWPTGHWVTGKFSTSGLAAIVQDLCNKAGLADERIDVTLLTQRVDGFVIVARETARSALEQLMATYFFDAVESDGVIKFIPRGQLSVATIESAALVRDNADVNAPVLQATRMQDADLPRRVNISFIHRSRNYQSSAEHATRQTTDSRLVVDMNVPLVLSASEALIIADTHLYKSWLERTSYRFVLDMRYAALDAGDIVTITSDDATIQCRITRIVQDKTRLMIDAVADDVSIYDPIGRDTDTSRDNTTEAVTPIADTRLALLDIPAFPGDEPTHATLRIAARGTTPNWRGAIIYRSVDGQEYNRIIVADQPAIIGATTQSPWAYYYGNVMDHRSVIDVRILGAGELYSVSYAALLNGDNSCVIGNEIIQFQYAELLHSGKYRLRGLLRGRLGTEHAMNDHSNGEPFIMLNDAVTDITMTPSLFDAPRDYKAVSAGKTLGATEVVSHTYTAQSLIPYAGVQPYRQIDGADIIVSWIRRDRLYGHWANHVDIGLSEAEARFDVDIIHNDILLRTITSDVTQIRYDNTMQAHDSVVSGDLLSFMIYQLSSQIGRGNVLRYDLTLP